MISSIKTPGVYVIEKDAFPPSIAQVATAIPAFVGYTEKGPKNEPTKIRSLLEYVEKFGGAPAPEGITANVDANDYKVTESKFKMYNSLRLFFSNGGGECYIVSVGHYLTAGGAVSQIREEEFFSEAPPKGIKLLEKVDEITLILFPDAVQLTASNLAEIQKQALKQCGALMDRFSILDVKQDTAETQDENFKLFREGIGNQNLKYGAAYFPYLKSSVTYHFRLKQIDDNGGDFKVRYANDDDIKAGLVNYDEIYEDINNPLTGILIDWENAIEDNKKVEIGTDEPKVKTYYEAIWALLGTLGKTDTDLTNTGLKDFINDLISNALKHKAQKLIEFNAIYEGLTGATDPDISSINPNFSDTVWGDFEKNNAGEDYPLDGDNPFTDALNVTATTDPDLAKVQDQLNKIFNEVSDAMNGVVNAIRDYDLTFENNVASTLPIYPTIIQELSKVMNTTPPSGAIAGVYANVDFTRGVWKAPANVSLNGVTEFTADINDKEQETMNIHETGKSINALRKFAGRGLYVWGARTLDGNSNDWRYINVRRLAIMIEESAKKACFNFVFEPNVKQTWVNVKGMISNYLTTLWGDGALAGAKPEDAFFVSVGLNETMSADDINNGRMIVKIGYAPSRTAEFIILEFTQMQQKS